MTPGLGAPVSFTVGGIKEALNQPHKSPMKKNEAVRNIESLLRNGRYAKYASDEKGNPMVKGYHYVEIDIDGEPSFAVIRDMTGGELVFYSIVENIKKKE